MVVVDTSAWVDFLKQPESDSGKEVARLLRDGEVMVVGQVLAEILQVFRETDFSDMQKRLSVLPYLEADQSAWISAAQIAAQLRARGQTTALSDLLIAAIAIQAGLPVFSTDPDFRRVPGLEIHEAPST